VIGDEISGNGRDHLFTIGLYDIQETPRCNDGIFENIQTGLGTKIF
jgi:hypothetical protein